MKWTTKERILKLEGVETVNNGTVQSMTTSLVGSWRVLNSCKWIPWLPWCRVTILENNRTRGIYICWFEKKQDRSVRRVCHSPKRTRQAHDLIESMIQIHMYWGIFHLRREARARAVASRKKIYWLASRPFEVKSSHNKSPNLQQIYSTRVESWVVSHYSILVCCSASSSCWLLSSCITIACLPYHHHRHL